MGQITTTRNLVAIKVVRHAGQQGKLSQTATHMVNIVSCRTETWCTNGDFTNHGQPVPRPDPT